MRRLAVAAVVLGLASGTASAADKVSLRLPWIYNVQAAAYIMAFEHGIYRDAGLDVEIRPGGPQINPNQLVATGQDTFGSNDYPNLIQGRARGMPLMVVAACWQAYPGGIYALEKSNIRTPRDLIGKKIAYDEGGPWTMVKAMLAKAGVGLNQVTAISTSGNEVLMSGAVDARTGFVINGPISIEQAGMKTTSMKVADYGINAAAEAIFTTEAYAHDHPDVVRRFVAATIEGYRYAYAHRDETLAVILKNNPQLKEEQQRQQLDRQAPLIFTARAEKEGLCSFSGEDIAQTADVLREFGGFKDTVDIKAMYSTDFLPKKVGG